MDAPAGPGADHAQLRPAWPSGRSRVRHGPRRGPQPILAGESLTGLGCRTQGSPSWVNGLGGTGATAEDAVEQVLVAFEELSRKQGKPAAFGAEPANLGYSGAQRQTWVASRDGRAYATIVVTATDGSYTAGPYALCGA